jgi:hypothetical protein
MTHALTEWFQERNANAKLWGVPEQWIVCPACSAQSWVLPPHGLDPCPLVVQGMEQLGLKFDAERMAAIRTGVSVEEMTRALREIGGEE